MAGVPFPGHTECLAHKTDTEKFAMMMASPKLKVTLVTIHEAIKDVPNKITIQRIFDAAHLTHDVLKTRFRIARPKIAVAALNPHSGDSGLFGDEEEKIIAPAIDKLNGASILTSGPYPADSIFHKAANGEYDAVVSMYHDQGLTAVKTLDFNGTVNISLGVPIIRTSVDHGTAEGIANKGLASDANLIAAVEMAVQMIEKGENNE
jgi:4-hydroxythreonine-4-phosphate dehydrogenase